MSTDLERIKRVRQSLPALEKITYFNTGSVGPLSSFAIDAMTKSQQEELYNSRITAEAFKNKKKIKDDTRESIAQLFSVTSSEISLTHNTTEGINIILSGIRWSQGDEVITSNVEHAAILLPLFVLRERYGVNIKTVNTGNHVIDDIKAKITPKTKIIAISHVSYATGEVLPIEEITELAHRNGVAILVDGAQSAGAIPVDLKRLNVDFYSVPGQKWLCGPEGTGALYVNNNKLIEVNQTYSGLGSVEEFDPLGTFKFYREAKHFEIASTFVPAVVGQRASIQWLIKEVGIEWVFERAKILRELAWKQLNSLSNVKVITPEKASGLISFSVNGVNPKDVVASLAAQGIIIRKINENNSVRASIGFFNSEDDIEMLIRSVSNLCSN
ncbi:MAG: aminotransferase class V-fold PLP-dependent enzyme [Bacillota bacterium]|nr:aminotransferase class V-fold PLP-dependent enzyme [Bacillota bacterium]